MFFLESDAKASKTVDEILDIRRVCANSMVIAAQTMAECRKLLWQRGVPDEATVGLPCRIAYPMLEAATGVVARKNACGDQALQMIAITSDSNAESLLNTVTAALMDLMHSFEHMASLTAELCTLTKDSRLTIELIREVGRLDGDDMGVKNVASFVSEIAALRPRLVLQNISHLLPRLDSEPYSLRSAIVMAIASLAEYLGTFKKPHQTDDCKNEDESHAPVQNIVQSRTALLDILCARVYDVSSFTRAAVLKAWIHLCQTKSIPKELTVTVTRLAMDRLRDKTVLVRKQSMVLLTMLLESNPFLGSLDPEPYRAKLAELYDYIQSHLPASIREAKEHSMQGADADETTKVEIERATLAAAMSEADVLILSKETLTNEQQEYCSKVQALQFVQSALDFIDIFEDATDALEGMLLSASSTDVTEALRFFVQARRYKLPCAVTGIRRALALMWSQESSIREEVLKAFVDVFIAIPGTGGANLLPSEDIAQNLLVLVAQASVSELASIEEAIVRLLPENRLPDDVFLILWSIAGKGNCDARAAALHLLSMGSRADRSIIDSKSRLKLLLDAAFSGSTADDMNKWKVAGAAAMALQRVGRAVVDPSDAKYLVLERIMEELCFVCQGNQCDDNDVNDTLHWFSASEQAMKALFVISPEPEVSCKNIVVALYRVTFNDPITHSLRLTRFVHILGQIALNLLVYTEALTASVRRAAAKRSLKNQEDLDKSKTRKRSSILPNIDDDGGIEAELGVAAQLEAANEQRLAEISENEIVGRNLLSLFGPLLVRVVSNEGGKFNSEILMKASTLALCKFMCVSGSFCEKHLPLLFTALANAPSKDTTLRANTVVALGDLAFRFPNEIEPYTPRLYACLRDQSTKVRRHTLMVLTHLILNDMIKVKGQVCEIAICLRDNDPRIRDMSRLLFHELSKRSNNPIYNLLPEIISQLSLKDIFKEDFRNIMSFLLGFIKKERQNEMLTDKLCQRFSKCSSIDQSADLAFCIAQLKMNEKSIKCLSDNFNLYKDVLFDDDVQKSFLSIVSKTKKILKPERRQQLDEWESKLSEFACVGAENNRASQKAMRAKARALSRGSQKKAQMGLAKDNQVLELSSDAQKENVP